jgi:Zn-dependent protease with chaperone function
MQNKQVTKVYCWIFALTAVLYTVSFLRSVYAIGHNSASLTPSNLLVFVLFEAVVAAVTGMAWWAILKGEVWARACGIAASLMYILIFLRPIILHWRTHHLGALVIGVLGLVHFLGRYEQHDPNPRTT